MPENIKDLCLGKSRLVLAIKLSDFIFGKAQDLKTSIIIFEPHRGWFIFLVRGGQARRGFSTLEILLAMTVMVFTLSAAVLLSFSGQSLAQDSQLSSEAQNFAQKLLESQRELAQKDFRLVNPTSTLENGYQGKIEVARPSFFSKNVKATVSWNVGGRPQKTEMSTLITDYNGTAGNDTCDSFLSGDWTQPQVKKVIDFGGFAEVASSTYAMSDIDAYKSKLYVSIGKTANKTDSTFFIFDIANQLAPSLLYKIDNSTSTAEGINGITVNGDYAYTASASSKQFQIIDIAAIPPKIIFDYKITGGGDGESVFYKNGYVYLGLSKKDEVREFYIFDVNDLENIHLESSYSIGVGVNSIYVKNNLAYLATTDKNRELVILDISNPAAPVFSNSYNVLPDQTNWGYGKTVEVIGDKIFLGRTYITNSPEFYIFDISMQAIDIAGKYPKSNYPFSANGLIVRGGLAFLLAGSGSQGGNLKLLDISNPSDIIEKSIIQFPNGTTGLGGTTMDCEGNYLYAGSVDGSEKSYISVIAVR